MKSKKIVIPAILFFLFAIYSQAALAGQKSSGAPMVEVLTVAQLHDVADAEATEPSPGFLCKKSVTVGAGASAGFIAGSVVPGIGNILGGLLGGVIGYFAHSKRHC